MRNNSFWKNILSTTKKLLLISSNSFRSLLGHVRCYSVEIFYYDMFQTLHKCQLNYNQE